MDSIVNSFLMVFQVATGKVPTYKVRGGTETENLALQNIQVRVPFDSLLLVGKLSTCLLITFHILGAVANGAGVHVCAASLVDSRPPWILTSLGQRER